MLILPTVFAPVLTETHLLCIYRPGLRLLNNNARLLGMTYPIALITIFIVTVPTVVLDINHSRESLFTPSQYMHRATM